MPWSLMRRRWQGRLLAETDLIPLEPVELPPLPECASKHAHAMRDGLALQLAVNRFMHDTGPAPHSDRWAQVWDGVPRDQAREARAILSRYGVARSTLVEVKGQPRPGWVMEPGTGQHVSREETRALLRAVPSVRWHRGRPDHRGDRHMTERKGAQITTKIGLAPCARAEAQRILDAAARRLLAAQLDDDAVRPPPRRNRRRRDDSLDEGSPLVGGEDLPIASSDG